MKFLKALLECFLAVINRTIALVSYFPHHHYSAFGVHKAILQLIMYVVLWKNKITKICPKKLGHKKYRRKKKNLPLKKKISLK